MVLNTNVNFVIRKCINNPQRRQIIIFGILTILFWLSNIFYLPPFNTDGIKSLVSEAHEAKDFAPEINTPKEVLKNEIVHAFRIAFITALLIIIAGVV